MDYGLGLDFGLVLGEILFLPGYEAVVVFLKEGFHGAEFGQVSGAGAFEGDGEGNPDEDFVVEKGREFRAVEHDTFEEEDGVGRGIEERSVERAFGVVVVGGNAVRAVAGGTEGFEELLADGLVVEGVAKVAFRG